ncbi:glycosyltransferase family 1 protein [Flavobacterium sp.]|uniref:glycosyltransferase family 4 protein n=1 Tax=Flavobacterium sp. TaxID=239 RepID=UPI002CE14933|nr:glycosyltransferase family 1 protein [Flavobacterium sp.]HSD06037.1 glycosyltransferase family 1 protein [Flavobacterium sp.]
MNIIVFAHPTFLDHQSMPRYANMIEKGMIERGHSVEIWTASPLFFNFPLPKSFKKWMGYIDQFVMFPMEVKKKLKKCSPNTLYVFSDHALGPWIPLVSHKKHVIHCHDFLAQQSALGEIPENNIGLFGKIYQKYIRQGYRKGENFISISKKTQTDLHHFLEKEPHFSKVVYNGLNQDFKPNDPNFIRKQLSEKLQMNLNEGYVLHVGGNQFYKNRKGVIEIYTAWRKKNTHTIPLLMIGNEPNEELKELRKKSPFSNDIYFLSNINDEILRAGYQGATVLLFPSLAEGFGWPIVEAMASGCPVITTNEAPMTEVGGKVAYYLNRRPSDDTKVEKWATESALVLDELVKLSDADRQKLVNQGLEHAQSFEPEKILDKIETIYKTIVENN